MEAWTFWTPLYWLSGYAKLITAIASVATAAALPPLVPRILGLIESARRSNERKLQLETANAELAHLNARLQELDARKSQLYANISHEFRTPLTLILSPTERMLATAIGEQRRDLELVARNAQLLQRRVDDLLDIARLEAGQLTLQLATVDLSRLAQRTADLFAATARERRLRLSVNVPVALSIQADGEQLQRVLVNLLSNAEAFTPDGGTVMLTAQAGEAIAVIAVEDSGPGVPEALRPVIFERFRQGDALPAEGRSGTGLGLAIARELVALHGGSIAVGPSMLGGARFTVTLPIGEVTAPAPAPPVAAPTAASSSMPAAPQPAPLPARAGDPTAPLILVVEDNAELRQYFTEVLTPAYRVQTAADGREGLAQAQALRPDLILSDVMMPELSGEQLVVALRGHEALRETPIIMVTALADRDLRVRLLRAGVQDYLLKPFATAELQARLANLLTLAQARATLQRALAQQHSNLATLSAEVTRLYQEAQEALRLREEFLVVAAHELRTPVTALMGNVQLLTRRWAQAAVDPVRDQRAVQALGQSAARLAALVETLLDAIQIDQEPLAMTLAPLDLGALVARQVALLQPGLTRHQLRLDLPAQPLMVRGDAQRLAQVVRHLLTNAVTYSPRGGEVVIVVAADAGMAWVTVRDQGIGIPDSAIPRLFERFYRAPNVDTTTISGFGLGLTLARQIIDQHGGSISVTSREGAGSTFTVSLPQAATEGWSRAVGA
ncbi:MAG: response regulator [Chloroflexales bacterium]|nr:response regulator [Chloroflexales bacterium]